MGRRPGPTNETYDDWLHARATATVLRTLTPDQVRTHVDRVLNGQLEQTRPGYLATLMATPPAARPVRTGTIRDWVGRALNRRR